MTALSLRFMGDLGRGKPDEPASKPKGRAAKAKEAGEKAAPRRRKQDEASGSGRRVNVENYNSQRVLSDFVDSRPYFN